MAEGPPRASLKADSFHKFLLLIVVIIFATIKLLAHYRFGTSFDSALFGNVAWRLGNGLDSVSTLTGFRYFATHASFIILLVAPVFRFLPSWGLPFTFVLQVISIGLVGIGVFRATSAFGIAPSAQKLITALTIFGPGAFLAARLDIHETTLGLGFLAMTLGNGLGGVPIRRSWWWPALAAACRIEMAVATLVAGIVLFRTKKSRPVGKIALAAGSGGLLFSLWFVLGAGQEAASVAAHFSHLGLTTSEVLETVFTHPQTLFGPLADREMITSLLLWLLPWGLVLPIVGWRYLLVALPMAGVAIMGVWQPADLYPHHYWYGFLVGAPIAAAEALRRRPDRLRLLRVSGLVGVVAAWIALVPFLGALQPFGRADAIVLRELVAYGSANEGLAVSAPGSAISHLVDRAVLFEFPRPFLCRSRSIGPFAWSGELPDLVLLSGTESEAAQDHPSVGPVLRTFYQQVEVPAEVAVYRLKMSPDGLTCL
jgi:hypothetical protein